LPSNRSQTLPPGGAEALPRQRLADLLTTTRDRTLALVAPVSENNLDRVHDPLMSPLVWDLGHIAVFEDLWLCHHAGGVPVLRPDLMEVYDAAETPRPRRGELPYLRHDDAVQFMCDVRERALSVLESTALDDGDFLWQLVIRHEQQHNETMLQTLALAAPGAYCPARRPLPAALDAPPGGSLLIEAGPFLRGAPDHAFGYDNERPRLEQHVDAFEIDYLPVTNGDYREFVDDGGYGRREWWSEEGWAWRQAEGVQRPLYWTGDGRERRFDRIGAIDPAVPVMHVSWFEADAFARSRDKRLPTEAEWEKAASWGPGASEARRYPWGDDPPTPALANLDQTAFRPAPAGAHPDGASAYGLRGMIGDAWEWTASDFEAHAGFRPYPYAEYSSVFFGPGHKVLRGGSWATRSHVISNTFRNWDLPQRRQIFAGFRCARDV
jgi:iron(II)-dependent oxidoreductase